MLQPARDRLDYSRIVMPPDGYQFDSAVGTTYSLDLAALLGITVALTLGQSPDERMRVPGIPLLEAMRKAAGRIALFCQAARISVPQEQQELYALLEKSIAQVLPPKEFSFHPKVWVLKYAKCGIKGDEVYRAVVLSRNLTFDRSWDVAAVIDGKPTAELQETSKPLVAFLDYLSGLHPYPEMRRLVKRMSSDISRVQFYVEDKRFTSVCFCPFGIGWPVQSPIDPSRDHVTVISPFLSKSPIESLKRCLKLKNGRMALISRRESLDGLDAATLKYEDKDIECYHLKDVVVDGESSLDDTASLPAQQNIHAKLYLTTRYTWSHLWLGSANCTERAFSGNIEFMVRFEGYQRYCNQHDLLHDLFGEDEQENPFTRYQPPTITAPPADDNEDKMLEQLARTICRSINKASAQAMPCDGDATAYSVTLTIPKLPRVDGGITVTIEPLCMPEAQTPMASSIAFDSIPLEKLNTLYVIHVNRMGAEDQADRAFVIAIPTAGIPENRDGAIYRSIIRNQDGFFAYIAFVLGEDYTVSLADRGLSQRYFDTGNGNGSPGSVVYEKMLKAASRRPEALLEVREIMDLCAEEGVLPQEFRDMYAKFESVASRRRRKR